MVRKIHFFQGSAGHPSALSEQGKDEDEQMFPQGQRVLHNTIIITQNTVRSADSKQVGQCMLHTVKTLFYLHFSR